MKMKFKIDHLHPIIDSLKDSDSLFQWAIHLRTGDAQIFATYCAGGTDIVSGSLPEAFVNACSQVNKVGDEDQVRRCKNLYESAMKILSRAVVSEAKRICVDIEIVRLNKHILSNQARHSLAEIALAVMNDFLEPSTPSLAEVHNAEAQA